MVAIIICGMLFTASSALRSIFNRPSQSAISSILPSFGAVPWIFCPLLPYTAGRPPRPRGGCRGVFPDVEVLLADGKQHGNILGLDDVPFAEAGILVLARDDLGDIMAEHLPCRVNSTDQFHDGILLTAQASGLRSSLPVPEYRSGQNQRRGYRPPPPAAGRKRAHPKWRCAPPRSLASRWI